jgi:hypothetical protein
VEIASIEHAFGDWKILSTSQPYTKKDSSTFEYNVKVPADGAAEVPHEIQAKP